jgi:hypothetical protein
MAICKGCGVQLDDDMKVCPLCETPAVSTGMHKTVSLPVDDEKTTKGEKKNVLQQILWQITAVLLLSAIVATLIIDLSIHGRITWSIYPISICLMVFSYASLIALWRTKMFFQLLAGWIISAMVLVVIHWNIQDEWPLKLALPLLSAVNVLGLLLNFILIRLNAKGLNVLAIFFVFIAILCLLIEGITSFYFKESVNLQWSIIVAACLLPVTTAILFMYFRTRNNAELQKIFHT